MKNLILNTLNESIAIKNKMLEDISLIENIERSALAIIDSIKNEGKLIVCGNGGSAGDAQHIAGEFINKFYYDRPAMPCISLSTDTSVITAIGNDSTFEDIFYKQISALGRKGDVFLCISTSGNSKNIIKAIEYCKKSHIKTIAIVGSKDCAMSNISDLTIHIPSTITPRIQECQLIVEHILCQIVEMYIFPKER